MSSPTIRIRKAILDDAISIREIYAPFVESTVVSFETEVPTVAEIRKRMQDRMDRFPWLVAEIGDSVAGYAYAGQFQTRVSYRWSVETSVYVAQDKTRRGLGRKLYRQLLPILQQQGFRMAFAGISLPNDASVGLHESLGFKPVAIFPNAGFKAKQWLDVGWWALDLLPHKSDTNSIEEPTPFSTFEWHAIDL